MSAFVASVHPAALSLRRTPWEGLSPRAATRSVFAGQPLSSRSSTHKPPVPICPATTTTITAVFNGGGFLGVGPAEVVVIVAVGWLLLGPEKLYSLARDTGKVLGQLRSSADQARETFSDALELELIEKEFSEAASSSEKTSSKLKSPPADAEPAATTTAPEDAPVGAAKQEPASAPETAATPDSTFSTTSMDASADADAGIADLLRSEGPPSPPDTAPVDPALNSAFLDQLRRVADPEQVAPPESTPANDVPEEVALEGATEEELEVERLERQYLEAKRKLEESRGKRKAASPDAADT